MTAIPSTPTDDVLVSCYYEGDGLAWVSLSDNTLLGWNVDAMPPVPIIVGSLTPAPPVTAPVISPQWVLWQRGIAYVPDLWRGNTFADFLTWIATNNGAQRQVGGTGLLQPALRTSFIHWAAGNPSLVWKGPTGEDVVA